MPNYTFEYQTGDMLFIKNAPGFISGGVRLVTGGQFSHVEAILNKAKYDDGHRYTISANSGKGVHYNSLNRYMKDDISFEVYRIKGGLSPVEKAAFWKSHKKYHGLSYDTFGAAGSANGWFWGLFRQNKDKLFCSELVAKMYKDIYRDLMPGHKPSELNPEELIKSANIEKVFDTDAKIDIIV